MPSSHPLLFRQKAEPPYLVSRCVCGGDEGGSLQTRNPRHLLLHRRTEQGQPEPASRETNLLANSGKGDAHHQRVFQEAALDEEKLDTLVSQHPC